jgi:hypothetical protein
MINKTVHGSFHLALVCVLLLGLAANGGCKSETPLIPVTGLLTIDGKPAANVSLQFLPDSLGGQTSGPSAYGTTDDQGRFTLQTHEGHTGAVEGLHVVMLADLDEERPAQGTAPTKPSRIPQVYATVSSPLRVTLQEGKEAIVEIKSR